MQLSHGKKSACLSLLSRSIASCILRPLMVAHQMTHNRAQRFDDGRQHMQMSYGWYSLHLSPLCLAFRLEIIHLDSGSDPLAG